MKLRRLQIDGFKALDGLVVDVPRDLLFLIGMNGAGKSSVLQAISFVRAFSEGNALSFFADRQWEVADVRPRVNLRTIPIGGRQSRLQSINPIVIRVLLDADDGVQLVWEFAWTPVQQGNLREQIWVIDPATQSARQILSYKRPTKSPDITAESLRLDDLKLVGSVLAFVAGGRNVPESSDKAYINAVSAWARGITSLELLSPVAMRKGVRGRPKDIGPRGERLAGFIAGLSASENDQLVKSVAQFYPINDLDAVRKNAGWVDLRVGENYPASLRNKPSQMSDGFMRILALCAIPFFEDSVSTVLLDEVEDGIEPHILPKIIQHVSANSRAQFIMTSHSPLLVNHFEPDEVSFLTRRPSGITALARTSDMKVFTDGAEFFGIGEIWANASAEVMKHSALASTDAIDGDTDRSEEDRALQFAGAV